MNSYNDSLPLFANTSTFKLAPCAHRRSPSSNVPIWFHIGPLVLILKAPVFGVFVLVFLMEISVWLHFRKRSTSPILQLSLTPCRNTIVVLTKLGRQDYRLKRVRYLLPDSVVLVMAKSQRARGHFELGLECRAFLSSLQWKSFLLQLGRFEVR